MANYEGGVWRTIKGRRVFIKDGEDLASAMKRSGKFDNLNNEPRTISKEEYDKKPKDYKGTLKELVDTAKFRGENPEELRKMYEKMGYDVDKDKTILELGEDGGTRLSPVKIAEEKAKKINETMDKRASIIKKLDNDTKDLSSYDKYNLAVSKLENNDYSSPTERQYWAGEIERYKNRARQENAKIDYNKINEKTTISFGKVDAYGNGRKSNELTVEMQLKDGKFTASGNIWNSKHTDIISGGQNLDEMRTYLKGNKQFENVYDMWKKHHLNDMHAGTIRQEEALQKKFGGVNASKYDEQVNYLKSIGIYEDEGYKFGTGWLKRDIPEEDLKNITNIIRSNNGKNSLAKMSLSELRKEAQKYNIDTTGLSEQKLRAKLIAIFK